MSNPVLNADRWNDGSRDADIAAASRMTVDGTVTKTFLLTGLLLVTLAVMWSHFWQGGKPADGVMPWMIGGAIGGATGAAIGSDGGSREKVIVKERVVHREVRVRDDDHDDHPPGHRRGKKKGWKKHHRD